MHDPFIVAVIPLQQQALFLQHLERLRHGPLGQAQVLGNGLWRIGIAIALREIVQRLELHRTHALRMTRSADIRAHQVPQAFDDVMYCFSDLRHTLIVACRNIIDKQHETGYFLFRVDTFMADTAMNVDVYDTYALTEDGHRLHFDVFLPAGCGAHCDEKAANIARTWLRSIGINPDRIELEQCRFCHTEAVNPAVSEQLELQGWFILPMEGCPSLTPNH